MIISSQILSAIQTRLTGDATLTAIVPSARIGTWLPDDLAFPHIIWSVQDTNYGIKGEQAMDIDFVLEVWSESESEKEILDIRDALVSLFGDNPITIASGSNAVCYYDGCNVSLDSDGITRNATITFRLIIGE